MFQGVKFTAEGKGQHLPPQQGSPIGSMVGTGQDGFPGGEEIENGIKVLGLVGEAGQIAPVQLKLFVGKDDDLMAQGAGLIEGGVEATGAGHPGILGVGVVNVANAAEAKALEIGLIVKLLVKAGAIALGFIQLLANAPTDQLGFGCQGL